MAVRNRLQSAGVLVLNVEPMQDNLESIVARLESAVTRLEKYERGGTAVSRSVVPEPTSTYSRAPAVAPSPAPLSASAPSSGSPVPDLDAILEAHLIPYMQCASSLGDDVLKVSSIVERAFKALRTLVDIASRSKKPDDLDLQNLVQPLSTELIAASKLTEGRRSALFNHHKTVAEALQAFTFVVYSGAACGMSPPAQLVLECWQSSEFYANKIIMEHKGKEAQQVEWVKLFKELMMKLQQHVRSFHPTGLKWNPSGGEASEAAKSPTAAPPSQSPTPPACTPTPTTPPPTVQTPSPVPEPEPTPAVVEAPKVAAAAAAPPPGPPGGPPPPPPPPSAKLMKELATVGQSSGGGGGGGGASELFSALNKGAAITSGLKKVTADMKTKNRGDRTGAVPARAASTTPTEERGAKAPQPKGQPKIELQQKRWVVEHQMGNKEIVLDDVTPQQTVYVYCCTNSVIQVKGKCNSISLDGCKATGVVFENVISSVEAVNCTSCQVQFTGMAPTANFDKCDGMQLYVPAAAAADPLFQVVTAKCSEINVVAVPEESPEGEEPQDPVEHAVPEQFISSFKDGKLVTLAAVHSGA